MAFLSRALILLLVFFSMGGRTLKAHEPEPGEWTPVANLETARACHTATLLPNGHVLICGGHGPAFDLSSVEIYLPAQRSFVPGVTMLEPRRNHTATLLKNGKVLVAGGQTGFNTLASAELYDPATGKWAATGNLHLARSYHTATLLTDGRVLIVGGAHVGSPPLYAQGAPPGSALDSAELYDPATEKWTLVGRLHAARYIHAAALLPNGHVLVAGGLGLDGANNLMASAETYNPETKEWKQIRPMPLPLVNLTMTPLPNRTILVAGGKTSMQSNTEGAEIYRPSSETWEGTASLVVPTNAHTATLLPNQNILIAGGANEDGTTMSAELYQPSTGIWTETGTMKITRCLHTATLLPDGQVLVVGGAYQTGDPSFVTPTAEIYFPDQKTKAAPTAQEKAPAHKELAPRAPTTFNRDID